MNPSSTGWPEFSTALCNTSDINSTYQSNHTLEDLGYQVPDRIRSYLYLNKMDAQCKGRCKILAGNCSMEPFAEMEVELLVHVLAWSASQALRLRAAFWALSARVSQSALFHFLRSEPFLFGRLHGIFKKKSAGMHCPMNCDVDGNAIKRRRC